MNTRNDRPILISIDYHETDDELIDHQDVTMTRNEMRALMVWLAKIQFSHPPSENCGSAINKVYHLLRTSNNAITDLKEQKHGPLHNPTFNP